MVEETVRDFLSDNEDDNLKEEKDKEKEEEDGGMEIEEPS